MYIASVGGGNKQPIFEEIATKLDTSNVVIIPSACSTQASYDRKVPACTRFFEGLGLQPTILHEFSEIPSADKVSHAIGQASLAYVIGGNMPYLLDTLSEHGTDYALRTGVHNGMWLTGTSAGALLPFNTALSCPAKKPAEEQWDYTYMTGLSLLSVAATAHANQVDPHPSTEARPTRLEYFAKTLPPEHTLGLGIENHAALIVEDMQLRVARASASAALHIVEFGEILPDTHDDEQLTELFWRHIFRN